MIVITLINDCDHPQHDEIDRLERLLQGKASDLATLTEAAGFTSSAPLSLSPLSPKVSTEIINSVMFTIIIIAISIVTNMSPSMIDNQ